MAFIYRQSEEDEEWDSVSWNLRNWPPPPPLTTVNGAVDRPFWGSSGRVYPQFRKKDLISSPVSVSFLLYLLPFLYYVLPSQLYLELIHYASYSGDLFSPLILGCNQPCTHFSNLMFSNLASKNKPRFGRS